MAFGGLDRELARALQRFFGLLPVGIGPAVGTERPDVENSEQVETMQLGRELKPRLSRMARQMLRRIWALLGAHRLGRLARRALAGVAFEQAEMRMFRRRTGHESLTFRPQTEQSTMVFVRSG